MTEPVRKRTDLHEAIASKDWSTVRRLTAVHPEWLNVQEDELGNTPLIEALKFEKKVPLDVLADIASKMPTSAIDIQNDLGWTALLIAASSGYVNVVNLMIARGANKNIQMKAGATALIISAQNGHTDICRLLIDSGANKEIKTYGWTALMIAAHFNRYDIVKLLLEKNANKNETNMYGDTALHAAAHLGYASVVKLLVDAGASVLQSKNGNTPLHACFRNQNLSYDQHRKVTVAFMMTDHSIASVKNKDDKTVIDLYEEHEYKKYDREGRSVQKEELLQILKGGPLPAIDFTYSGRSIPSLISVHGSAAEKVYIEALEEGAVNVNLGMVKVIGQERVGKSCLINACLGKKFNPGEKITDAIATIKIVTKTAEEPNKWGENLTDSGSATEIYHKSVADSVIRKTVENSGIEGVDEPQSNEKQIKAETPTEKQQVAVAISDEGGSAAEIGLYHKSTTETVVRKTVEQCDLEGIDETPPKEKKIKLETPTENAVRTISDKGAGSSKEVDLQPRKVPREKIPVFKTETMPMSIQKRVVEGFKHGIYFERQGMGEWHMTGEETFNIWDYGGQVIYHGIHRIFMTSEAVYIVVFKLNVDLDAKAIVQDSSGRYRTHHLTNLEFILYWIQSVYTHSRQLIVDMTREICLPAIVIVGTHRNSLGANEEERICKVKEAFKKISDALIGKPYEKYVYKYLDIENDRSDIDKNTAELKKVLENLMTALVKTVPLKWMRFRCELEKLKVEMLVCPLKEVKELATNCGIDDEKQCVLLNFLYDLGEIIYMPDNDTLKDDVVLDPMGFVDIVKTVITVIPPELRIPMFKEYIRKLDDEGILEEDLLKHLWRKRRPRVDLKKFDFFVELMRRFGFLCERKTSKTSAGTRSFFVPLRLALEPPTVEQREVDSCGMRAISIYHDFCGYLPDELFPQIVTEFIDKFQEETGDEPELARDHAELYFDERHHVVLSVVTFETKRNERKRLLMTTILRRESMDETETDQEPSSKACTAVLAFLEASFKLSQQGGRRGIQFKRCIPCICSKNSEKKKHMQMLGNFEKKTLPCGRKEMSAERYKQLFTYSSEPIPKEQSYAEAFDVGLEESGFTAMLLKISESICEDLTMWKVALKDRIMDANAIQKATNAIPLFKALIDSADLKAGDIRILLEAIHLTGVKIRLQKCIPNCP